MPPGAVISTGRLVAGIAAGAAIAAGALGVLLVAVTRPRRRSASGATIAK